MRATYLNSSHKNLGGYMVDFSGWEMPLHYGSQLNEHNEVRTNVGVFDVSHMAVFDLDGEKQEDFLRFLLPNDVKKISGQNKAIYSPMLNYDGGILDDLIVYYLGNKNFRIVSNCATREQNFSWLSKIAEPFNVGIDFKSDYSILALQGPNSYNFIKDYTVKEISKFAVHNTNDVMIAATGYTGELGFEIISNQEVGIKFWDEFISNGVQPIGLAARDTLRLEAGLNLYGTDMNHTNNPYDSNIGWTIDLNDKDRDFIGKSALNDKKDSKKILKGFYTEERGVLRGGADINFNGGSGVITSGTWSPTFKKNIGFCRVGKNCGEIGSAVLRDKKITLKFCNTNFLELRK
jgi:aminomethyltransferase